MSLKRPFAGEESCKQGCYFINGTIMILSEKREKYENQKSTKCMSYFGMYSGNRTYRVWENRLNTKEARSNYFYGSLSGSGQFYRRSA